MVNNFWETTNQLSKRTGHRFFLPCKWSKWDSQRAKMWPTTLILEVIYRLLDLKLHLKIGLLRPKIMRKQLLNTTPNPLSKIPKNDFFGHKKGSNHGYQFWQMCRLGSWFVFSVFTIVFWMSTSGKGGGGIEHPISV